MTDHLTPTQDGSSDTTLTLTINGAKPPPGVDPDAVRPLSQELAQTRAAEARERSVAAIHLVGDRDFPGDLAAATALASELLPCGLHWIDGFGNPRPWAPPSRRTAPPPRKRIIDNPPRASMRRTVDLSKARGPAPPAPPPKPPERLPAPTDGKAVSMADGIDLIDREAADEIVEGGEQAMAEALHGFVKDKVRFDRSIGCWRIWNGTHWAADEDGVEMQAGVQELYRLLREVVGAKAARPFGALRRQQAVVAHLRSFPGMLTARQDYNRHGDKLPVANGTVDLRTGALGPADPDLMFSWSVPTAYVPDAPAPNWDRFVESCHPDVESRSWLLRTLGYGLTGEQGEPALVPIWFGRGSEGKSSMIGALRTVLGGDVVGTVPFKSIMLQAPGKIRDDLTAIRDSRFVFASEGNIGDRMDTGLVKAWSGGDTMMTEAKYVKTSNRDATPFPGLLVLSTNHRPRVSGQDAGIWRRLRVLFWTQQFEADDWPDLADDLAADAEGILACLVREAKAYYGHGVPESAPVEAETASYRVAQDPLAEFLTAWFVPDPKAKAIPTARVWERFKRLYPDSGFHNQGTFMDALEDRGLAPRHPGHNRQFSMTGRRLVDPEPGGADGIFPLKSPGTPDGGVWG